MHAKIVFKDFEIKNLGKYHDLYVQINKLLSADAFDIFWNMCLETFRLDPVL